MPSLIVRSVVLVAFITGFGAVLLDALLERGVERELEGSAVAIIWEPAASEAQVVPVGALAAVNESWSHHEAADRALGTRSEGQATNVALLVFLGVFGSVLGVVGYARAVNETRSQPLSAG